MSALWSWFLHTNTSSWVIEDLRDNSDITRLKGLLEKDIERVQKYHKAYLFLRGVLETRKLVGYSTSGK